MQKDEGDGIPPDDVSSTFPARRPGARHEVVAVEGTPTPSSTAPAPPLAAAGDAPSSSSSYPGTTPPPSPASLAGDVGSAVTTGQPLPPSTLHLAGKRPAPSLSDNDQPSSQQHSSHRHHRQASPIPPAHHQHHHRPHTMQPLSTHHHHRPSLTIPPQQQQLQHHHHHSTGSGPSSPFAYPPPGFNLRPPPQQQQQSPSPAGTPVSGTNNNNVPIYTSTGQSRLHPQPLATPQSYPFPPDNRPRLLYTLSCPPVRVPQPPPPFGVHRQVSVPVTQREHTPAGHGGGQQERPPLQRYVSRTQTIKNYIRKSTATFFGVDHENEEDHHRRWLERRRRMASKRYGSLKDDGLQPPSRDDVISPGETTAAQSVDTPDSVMSRSWPRQVSTVSDVPDGSLTTASSSVRLRNYPRKQKDSVVRLTWNGLTYIASTVSRRRQKLHASVPPPSVPVAQNLGQGFQLSSIYDDSVFDDVVDSLPPTSSFPSQFESLPSPGDDSVIEDVFYDRMTPPSPALTPHMPPDYISHPPVLQVPPGSSLAPSPATEDESRKATARWRRSVPEPQEVPDQEELSVGMKRMWKRITDQLSDNSDRRQYGIGVVGRYLKRSFRKERITSEVKEQLDDMDDHRPFFTYWVTTVQILITIISLAVYGFGPIGFEQTQRSGLVLVTSLSLQQVDYYEPDNFWIGPRAADLVHLGAKFAPCMRKDRNVFQAIERDRSTERNTACCIRNDNSGCVQTSRDECSVRMFPRLLAGTTISTWKKWDFENRGPGGRISGSVCGQDPSYCTDPPSAPPYSWPDDITKWPICRRKTRSDLSRAAHEHMACEVIGHPCCIGILGECHITTREYCDFVKGFFHEEAALCSQVSCLDDICGMIPFYNPDVPDQFYRLWTSLFLHAGLVHLSVSVLVQFFLMRDLEKLTGALRISLIYVVSGVAGNLASAIFVPYRAEVGPAGSQFGLLACLIVEVIHCWQMLKKPGMALAKLLVIVFVLFILGLLPWIDNYAHLFGFIFGFLLSYALLPFVSFGVYDRRKKVTLIWICLLIVLTLFSILLLLFYIYPIYECEFCKYLTCLPLTQNFCTTQDINITSRRQL